ncbi:MAG: acyltransferase, partial [Allobranchiibius sp.]
MTSDRHRSLSYRPALDGLRGLAVAAVVVYHVWPDALPGGWLGVDVFFVLSGFLITSLLVAEWNSWGTISLLGFWAARARRLLPALVAMLLAVSVASYFWTIPSRRLPVSLDVISALFYVANWRMLYSDEQYFADTVGLPSPVLHTWSLAIEEQYYLLFPLLLLLLLALTRGLSPHRRRNVLGAALLVLAALSAWRMGALYVPGSDPNRIYYGTDTRIFELFIGAAAGVWVGTREFRGEHRVLFDRLMGWLTWPALALLLFAFAVLRFDSAILFPGGLVLVCVVAA